MRICNYIIAAIYTFAAIAHAILAIKYRSKQQLFFITIYSIAAMIFLIIAQSLYQSY